MKEFVPLPIAIGLPQPRCLRSRRTSQAVVTETMMTTRKGKCGYVSLKSNATY